MLRSRVGFCARCRRSSAPDVRFPPAFRTAPPDVLGADQGWPCNWSRKSHKGGGAPGRDSTGQLVPRRVGVWRVASWADVRGGSGLHQGVGPPAARRRPHDVGGRLASGGFPRGYRGFRAVFLTGACGQSALSTLGRLLAEVDWASAELRNSQRPGVPWQEEAGVGTDFMVRGRGW